MNRILWMLALLVVPSLARAQVAPALYTELDRRAATQAPGYGAEGAALAGPLQKRQTLHQFFMLQAGYCYVALGIGGTGVRDLDLALYGPDGKRLVIDVGFDATPQIRYCVRTAAAYRLEATVKRGAGEVLVQLYGAVAPATTPAAAKKKKP
jgi:hypothetical protein